MQLVTEDNITELAAARWGTAHDPRLARDHAGAGAPPARLRPRGPAHRARVDGRDPVADAHRADQRREARGVHPRLGRAGPVDAGRPDEPPARQGRNPGDGAGSVPHRGLAGAGVRRRHVAGPARHSALRHRHRPRPRRQGRSAGRCSTCGRPTTTAPTRRSWTSTRPGCARSTPPRATAPTASGRSRRSGYSVPMDGPVGDLIGRTGHQPLPPGAHPLPAQRARLRAADHAPVPGGRRVPRQRRRVRHQGRAGGGLRARASRARPRTAARRRCRGCWRSTTSCCRRRAVRHRSAAGDRPLSDMRCSAALPEGAASATAGSPATPSRPPSATTRGGCARSTRRPSTSFASWWPRTSTRSRWRREPKPGAGVSWATAHPRTRTPVNAPLTPEAPRDDPHAVGDQPAGCLPRHRRPRRPGRRPAYPPHLRRAAGTRTRCPRRRRPTRASRAGSAPSGPRCGQASPAPRGGCADWPPSRSWQRCCSDWLPARPSGLRTVRLTRAGANTDQLVRMQAIQTHVVQADADATNAFLVGGLEPPAQRADYTAAITSASQLIAEAAQHQPADGPALGALNQALVAYASRDRAGPREQPPGPPHRCAVPQGRQRRPARGRPPAAEEPR